MHTSSPPLRVINMLDILIGSLMVALALVAVYWILVFGRPLVRGAKDSRGAVETPPVAFNFDTEKVKVFTPTENFAPWCCVYSPPRSSSARRLTKNELPYRWKNFTFTMRDSTLRYASAQTMCAMQSGQSKEPLQTFGSS